VNKKDSKSLSYRKDGRTQRQFERDLKRDTAFEQVAALMIKKNLLHEGKKVSVKDYGMDNSGDLVTDSSEVSAKPDYLFVIDGQEHLYEIKVHSDKYPCMTFKASNIRSYIRQKAECVVVTESGYYIFNKEAMKYMTNNCSAQSYRGFAGGKESYRLMKAEMSALIYVGVVELVKWNSAALKLFNQYSFIFERRK